MKKLFLAILLILTTFGCIFNNNESQVAPSASSELSAFASNPSELTLTWKDNSKNELGFIIELKEEDNEFAVIDTVDTDSALYIVSGLKEFYIYTFRIN